MARRSCSSSSLSESDAESDAGSAAEEEAESAAGSAAEEEVEEAVEVAAEAEELTAESLTVEEENDTTIKLWHHEGQEYYKNCDNEYTCPEEECSCLGVVYDTETQDPVGTWDGHTLTPLKEEED